jgi:hypothetical protein
VSVAAGANCARTRPNRIGPARALAEIKKMMMERQIRSTTGWLPPQFFPKLVSSQHRMKVFFIELLR